jgi:hypothetical protein
MENQNPSSELSKEREYEEIQNRATRNGHLEDIHTHESSDIFGIMNNPRNRNTKESAKNVPSENPGKNTNEQYNPT